MVSVENTPNLLGTTSLSEPIRSFLLEAQADLTQGMLSPRVFADKDLHQTELARIFARCWVYVGHISEIPNPGDYVVRNLGEDEFILVRDEQGQIQLLLNSCVHRGASVCRAERGNASHFRCPYHGWIYKNSGAWNGAPFRAKVYRELDTAAWGLRRAPHVDSYHGLVFACLDPDAIPLREYLGDMCWYLDTLFGLNEQGMAVFGDPHRWVAEANWKSGADNFVGDSLHTQSLHRFAEEVGMFPPGGLQALGVDLNFHVRVDGGHGMIVSRNFLPEPYGPMNFPPEVASTFDLSGLSAEQRTFLDSFGVTGFTIFPNLSFIQAGGLGPDGMPLVFTILRQWQPRGPEQVEILSWPMVWPAAPAAFNQASYDAAVIGFSPSGMFEQDDTAIWAGATKAGRAAFVDKNMKLNLQMGMEGMSDYELVADWIGPGEASTNVFGEVNQRRWWERWCRTLLQP